jgi:hypothetical protein
VLADLVLAHEPGTVRVRQLCPLGGGPLAARLAKNLPPAGRASGPTTRAWPRRPGLPALDRGALKAGPPDPARRVQVVRPVGRSTWTRRAEPGWGEPARREAEPIRTPNLGPLASWGNPGDDLAKHHQRTPRRPTHASAKTRALSAWRTPEIHVFLVDTEESLVQTQYRPPSIFAAHRPVPRSRHRLVRSLWLGLGADLGAKPWCSPLIACPQKSIESGDRRT